MGLIIQTTGLEDFAPGGKARVKVLVIGGPGAGKTRWSSYFPKPIYADCERGLASLADRKFPYVTVNTSQDMLDLLAHLKQECQQPSERRAYETVVIDTLDAFQRKIKDEWMQKEKKSAFTGWEAWSYLNARMQMLLTRLLNLDMNVLVAVHLKDRTTKDVETGNESHSLMLQLQGETADTAYNDFDLVGWMGTYWEADGGERTQKRGLTFKPTPDKPFLKDRLHVTPPWLEVKFDESDYKGLFERIQSRLADMDAGEVVGEIASEEPAPPPATVVPPGLAGSGPVPEQAPRDVPYSQMDKPTLLKICRDRLLTETAEGTPIRANTLKAELIAAIEAKDKRDKQKASTPKPAPAPAPAPPAKDDPEPDAPEPEPAAQPTEPDAPQPKPLTRSAPAGLRRNTKEVETVPGIDTIETEQGQVNTKTGEIVEPEPTVEQAVETVKEKLGGEVIGDEPPPAAQPAPAPAGPSGPPPAQAAAAQGQTCEECGKDLAGEKPDFVKLSYIKYRKRLCEADYLAKKAGATAGAR